MESKTAMHNLLERLEQVQKSCGKLYEVIFFDGVISVIKAGFIEQERSQLIQLANAVKEACAAKANLEIKIDYDHLPDQFRYSTKYKNPSEHSCETVTVNPESILSIDVEPFINDLKR